MKLVILQNSDVMGKTDSDSATQNYTETSGFVLGQKKFILLTCVIDVESLFTNIPLDDTIDKLVSKIWKNNDK